MPRYDYLVVGSGLSGATFAQQATAAGKKCLILEKRNHIAGNAYTKEIEGIHVHQYGAHIFHTNNKTVWDYVRRFAGFNHYINSPIANYKGEIYNLPFNMNTFNKMWGCVTPEDARAEIERQRKDCYTPNPENLEQAALNMVGRDIYEKLIRGYTEKQWGRPCAALPPSIIKRLPLRFTYDNNYFNAVYQGIPTDGYTAMVERMIEGAELKLNTDYLTEKESNRRLADRVIYTGPIDAYFDYCRGPLEYRHTRFDIQVLDSGNFQGNAVVNYTDRETPCIRIIEHKHFAFGTQAKTVISREYSDEWKPGMEPYYPLENEKNNALYREYEALARAEKDVVFRGRLGTYRYYDMDQVIAQALHTLR
ncbi:MAG: UDP-galactopyranose mutase [Spirochaetaceae bacterium]|jgi:UDP-galactopyranose mutase|nr:UDP-galactopyranose mutase [Spirochaetaceae bacterium]